MAVVFENRVVEACATLGTGNLVASGADLGYATFAEKVPLGSTIHYLCESVNAVGRPTGEYELGRGTYVAANTISRDSVVSSSNAGALVNFTQATKRLSLTVLAPTTTDVRSDWREVLGSQLEPGVIGYTAGSAPPPGWLKRNGAAVSRTVYAALFAVIGTTYGAGDGSTTFNLPDGRAVFDRGLDDGRGLDAGRSLGSYQDSDNKSHTHTGTTGGSGDHNHGVNDPGHAHPVKHSASGDNNALWHRAGDNMRSATGDGTWTATSYDGTVSSGTGVTVANGGNHTHTFTTAATGGAESRPRNVAYLPIIKY